ncbi:MAG: hypothetical protein ABFS22_12780 [Pseudomonadota bacterium]
MDNTITETFSEAFRGRFQNALRWEQLEQLWDTLRSDADSGWHIYAVGEAPPEAPASGELVKTFLSEIEQLLRKEHGEDYCGIVYADSLESPRFVKIFDPNNLGVQCGFSENPPLPGWILSRLAPTDLQADIPLPGNRRRWWQRLLGS